MVVAAVAEDGPSSVPFRASSKLKSQKSSHSSQHSAKSCWSYSTWLLIDVNEASLPFLRTLRQSSARNGASSPAGQSSEKLTESTENGTSSSSASGKSRTLDVLTQPLVAPAAPKDNKRISLQQQSHPPVSGNNTIGKKSGFMSRFRGTNQSISSADAFAPPPASTATGSSPVPPSSSWSMVDSPRLTAPPIREDESRSLHFAVTTSSPPSSLQSAQGLFAKSTPLLTPSSDEDALEWQQQVHSTRIDANGLAELLREVRPDAVYLGAIAPPKSRRSTLEALLRIPNASFKQVIVEPSAVRSFSPADAALFFSIAASQNFALSLPVRWESLELSNPDETLLVLETLQEARGESVTRSAAPDSDMAEQDVSLDKSFDVSISNIPTGLSGQDLNQAAVDTAALQTQLSKLQHQLKVKDEQISGLLLRQPAPVPAPMPQTPPPPPVPKSPSNNTNLAASKVLFVNASESPGSASRHAKSSALDAAPAITASPARAVQLASNSPTASPNSSKSGSGRVISALTVELQETKALLEATRTALQTVRTQSATYQAQADDMRGTLSRARLENDSSISVLARKDRQISEALERARKAESEAKELGRAGREWGTRMRQVEEELGKERVKCGRAEQQYETLSSEWKQARGRLIAEVKELRQSHAEQLRIMADEYQKILQFKDRLQQEWRLPSADGSESVQVLGPTTLLHEIAALNNQLVQYIDKEVHPLLARLQALEKREDQSIFSKLQYVTDELTRIKTLMRKGTISDPSQIPPAK